jgi:ABC-2 type transport system ATP-binding protein
MQVAMPPALVETRALTKTYSRVPALSDCTLAIEPGEVFGLLGPNGAGKTTLLRLLMGFLRPTSGTAAIAGRDCWRESMAVHAGVAYLPGDVRLVRGARARDVLTFFARLRGQEPARAFRVAERLGLDLSRRTGQMSTGMRQKVALAAALSVEVPLLILDEPTSNLDPTVRGTVLALVREASAAGRTVVFSSHVLSEIEQVCDRVVILRGGRIAHEQVISHVRRGHRIRATLTAPLPELPAELTGQLTITRAAPNRVMFDAPGDLAPLLGWLAALPLAEIRVEPIGLAAVYEQFHPAEQDSAEAAA